MSVKITPDMVKELRERTGVGMGKCKEALDQAAGNMDEAIDILRKAGMASAVKKEGREVNEGLVGFYEGKDAVSLVEVNAETDFVTQNEKFKEFLSHITKQVVQTKPAALRDLLNQPFSQDPSITIDQYRSLVIQSLGENIQIKRLIIIPKSSNCSVGIYSHMGGKIVCVVVLLGSSEEESLARDIAMHVAAEAPDYLAPSDIPEQIREKEADIARSQLMGKPSHMMDKIIEGKIKAFADQVCLLCQKYVKDNSLSISGLLEKESKRLNTTLAIHAFYRWKVGG